MGFMSVTLAPTGCILRAATQAFDFAGIRATLLADEGG
jgi:hypothetical protein